MSSHIDNETNIIVKSYCNCKVFKPVVGMEVECKIDIIHVHGIFLSNNGIKMIVPSSDNYRYEINKFIFGTREYIVGDKIRIKIMNVRYDKFTYSCVGKLILRI